MQRYFEASNYDHSQLITLIISYRDYTWNLIFVDTAYDLYRWYQDFVLLFPNDPTEWSFHVVVLFLNALPKPFNTIIVAVGYKLPRFVTLYKKHDTVTGS